MVTPTPLQAHLLKAVQNLAYDNEQLRERARTAGQGSVSPELVRTLDIGERSGEQLAGVALAVGVPKAWIDYARAAGQRGALWEPGQVLLGSGHVPRQELIAALGREIHRLQDMAGLGAAYTGRHDPNSGPVATFRRVMGMTWQRLGAVSHALALSEEERHQVWQRGPQHWSTVVAAQVHDYSNHELLRRWNQVAGMDFPVVASPVLVLQWAGITQEDLAAQMPISPDRMVELAATALTERATPRTVTDAGRDYDIAAGIDAAIDAAGVSALAATQLDPTDDVTAPAFLQRDLGSGPEP
ncbi:hypothetical protein [Nocardia xishanensis]